MLLFPVAAVHAQLPTTRLDAVLPSGGAQGAELTVRLVGGDLDEVETLRFTHPGIHARGTAAAPGPFEVPGPRTQNEYRVTIEDDVPAGVYEVAAVGRFGVSNARPFVVGSLKEASEADGSEVSLETTINGVIEKAAEIDAYTFTALRGDRVLVSCLAHRVDSPLDGALYMYDATGDEIARNRAFHRQDPFLDVTIPSDGEYTVKLRDSTYRGGNLFSYRLSIGTFPHVDYIFPPCVLPGQTTRLTLFGRNLPGGSPSERKLPGGGVLEKLEVSFVAPWQPLSRAFGADRVFIEAAQAGLDIVPYRLETAWGATPPVALGLASAPVVEEERRANETREAAQKVRLPCEVAGQFYPTSDRDWYEFEAVKGERLRVEVISQRMGGTSDPFLVVERVIVEDGKTSTQEIASADDIGAAFGPLFNVGSEDAALDFTVPETGTYRVLVEDLFGNSVAHPRNLYRLVLRDARPDFRLVAMPRYAGGGSRLWGSFLRRGGTYLLDVHADRRGGLDSPIRLRADGLPPGVSTRGAVMAPGQKSAVLILEAADDAGPWTGSLRIVGEAEVGANAIERQARVGTVAFPGGPQGAVARSRLTGELLLTVAASEQAAFRVESAPQIWEVVRGGETKIALQLARRGGFDRAVNCAPQALPSGVTFVEGKEKKALKTIAFAKDQSEQETLLAAKNDAALGLFTVYFNATASVSYRRNPEAAERAGGWKKKLEATIAALEKAVATSKQLAESAVVLEGLADETGGVVPATRAAAQETKAAAVKAGEESAAQLAAAKAVVDGVNKQAEETGKAAQAKDVNVVFAAGPLLIRVIDVPFELALERSFAVLSQGQRVEVSLSVVRGFGFDGEVVVRAELPGELKGVTCADVTVAKDADKGVAVFDVASDAATGRFVARLSASGTFAGSERKLTVSLPLRVVSGSLVSQ